MYRVHHTRAKGTVRAPKGSNGLGGVFDWLDLRTLMGVFGYIGEQRVDERQANVNRRVFKRKGLLAPYGSQLLLARKHANCNIFPFGIMISDTV